MIRGRVLTVRYARRLGRHALGRVLPCNGYGWCRHCFRPWWAVRQSRLACVYFTESSSLFALCGSCWDDATPLSRFAAFSALVDQWERDDEDLGRTEPRDPDIAVIRDRLAKAILQYRDPFHFRSPLLRRPVIGAPPPEFRGRR